TGDLARTGTPASTTDACSPLPVGSLDDRVALIQRGGCDFYVKARNAELAGADAVVIYNNTAGLQNITVAGSPAVTIPVVSITQSAGLFLDNLLALGNPVTITWQEGFI